jgi:flavin reductase (DIM6/NTAB) family NADH-FMN oxidoreductase RutF
MTIGIPEAPIHSVPSDDFRSLMCAFPTGVSIVTTIDDHDAPWGMTCSSVCSVTLEPPTLLVCLRNGSPTLAALLGRSAFAVNLLHDGAQPVAELFASGRPDRFDQVDWVIQPGWAGPHLVGNAHAVAHCQVAMTQPVSDHTVVFGHVFQVSLRDGQRPLLYGLRRYAAWSALAS